MNNLFDIDDKYNEIFLKKRLRKNRNMNLYISFIYCNNDITKKLSLLSGLQKKNGNKEKEL